MRCGLLIVGLGAGACVAHAQDTVFDNITDNVGAFQAITNFDPNLAMIDDLRIVGGGELDALTFTYGYSAGFGGPGSQTLDLDIALLLDDGDGVFEIGEDAPLHAEELIKLDAELGVIHEFTLNLPGGIIAPDNATIWFATSYTASDPAFVNIGQGLYNDYTLGSSDEFVYIFDFANNNLQSFPQGQGEGLGAVLTVVPAPASLLVLTGLPLATRRRRN